ncbi:hypothetical protein [Nonomuraea turkmeniaca]|uniref:hypothetical protein n=1 Tax=Nonomuraea turkmeniaca TaxID=103838 RepID=UPI0014775538|nr:hypothetical protein [Nonomuraea turkmeniaca]
MGADPESRFEEIYGSSYGPLLGYALRRCADPDVPPDSLPKSTAPDPRGWWED